jgi:hypothetical protein
MIAFIAGPNTWAAVSHQASITVFNMIAKFVVLYPIYIFLIVTLVSEHTVPSLLLAVVFLMLFGFSIFTTSTLIRLRRERGENWFTGLAPKMRSDGRGRART